MSKDITVVRDVLCGYAQRLSLKKIQEVTRVPKTSVRRIVDQAHATEFSIEALFLLPDEAIIELMMPFRCARMNYVEPDWESVYFNCERSRKPLGALGLLGTVQQACSLSWQSDELLDLPPRLQRIQVRSSRVRERCQHGIRVDSRSGCHDRLFGRSTLLHHR